MPKPTAIYQFPLSSETTATLSFDGPKPTRAEFDLFKEYLAIVAYGWFGLRDDASPLDATTPATGEEPRA